MGSMDTLDLVLAGLRLWLGIVMIAHGVGHARKLDGTARWFEGVGFRSPRLQAMGSAAGELAIGGALVAGLLTSVAAAGLVAVMAVAFWSIHRFAGFFVYARPDEGYEYVATLALVATAVAVLGPGTVSLDAIFGIADRLDGAVGLGLVGAALVVAALHLAATWRRPDR